MFLSTISFNWKKKVSNASWPFLMAHKIRWVCWFANHDSDPPMKIFYHRTEAKPNAKIRIHKQQKMTSYLNHVFTVLCIGISKRCILKKKQN